MNSQRTIVLVTTLIALTLGFYDNTWKSTHGNWFSGFAKGAQAKVITRLAKSRQDGIFSEGGLLGREDIIPKNKHTLPYQYEIYYNNIPIQHYMLYKSNPAMQGIIFSILDRYLGLDARTNVKFFRLIASIISASILSVFLLWVLDIFGPFSAFMTLVLIMLSPWLTVSGGHLFWMFGMIYLPFVIPLILLHREYKGGKLTQRVWIPGISLAVLLKCLFTGYEFITTTLVMMTIPLFFYALWQKWKPRLFIQRFLSASFAGILGILACAVILSLQIAQVDGSMQKGLEHIQQRFLYRTYPKEGSIKKEVPQMVKDTQNVSVTTVLKTYLGGKAFSISTRYKDFNLSFGSLLLIFAAFSAIVFITAKNSALVALTITSWLSILAPLSWFIIFKSHSVLHTHLNYLAWYMPTLLLVFVSVSSLGNCWRRK
jgi:hypothetical protein